MARQLDSIDIAILTRINDLAARYGVKPYEFVATLDHSLEVSGMGVKFVVPGETGPRQEAKVKKMLESIGVDDMGVLKGGEKAVIDAIDAAFNVAPKPHGRS